MGQVMAPNTGCGCLASPEAHQAEYLAQYSGYGGGHPAVASTQFFQNLEQRRSGPKADCCAFLHCDNDLLHPSFHRPFQTDIVSLADTGAGFDCAEVCRAVCVLGVAGPKDHGPPASRIREGLDYIDFDPWGPDAEVFPVAPPAPLSVPPEFRHVEYDWALPSEQQKEITAPEVRRLQECMKPFIRAMLDGVLLQLRLDPSEAQGVAGGADARGQNIDAMVSFSSDLATMLVSVGGVRRTVPLDGIRWVRPPPEVSDGSLLWFLPGERAQMVVLRIQGGKFLRLRFARRDQAAYFGTCMRLLVKARGTQSATTSDRTSTSTARSNRTAPAPWEM